MIHIRRADNKQMLALYLKGCGSTHRPYKYRHSVSSESPQPLSRVVAFIGHERQPAGPGATQTEWLRLWEHEGKPRLCVCVCVGGMGDQLTKGAAGIGDFDSHTKPPFQLISFAPIRI